MGYRSIRFFTTSAPTASASATITYPGTHHTLNAAGSLGSQKVLLPGTDAYPGDECCVEVQNAVAQTVLVRNAADSATIDTFAASAGGARTYVWNGTAWQKKASPAA